MHCFPGLPRIAQGGYLANRDITISLLAKNTDVAKPSSTITFSGDEQVGATRVEATPLRRPAVPRNAGCVGVPGHLPRLGC
jgi:hypothetical protein